MPIGGGQVAGGERGRLPARGPVASVGRAAGARVLHRSLNEWHGYSLRKVDGEVIGT